MKMSEEFYILKETGKSILSIIYIDTDLPLPEETHQEIRRLQEVSDIFFIYPLGLFKDKSAQRFGSLYQACGYIETCELGETLMRILEYDKEILGGHILTMYTQTSGITKLGGERLQKLAGSDITKPIFKSRELESTEFFEIYREEKPKKKWWKFWTSDLREEWDDENCTHTSGSSEILMRQSGIDKMLEFWETKDGKKWIWSFKKNDLRYLIASLHYKLGIPVFDIDLSEYEEI